MAGIHVYMSALISEAALSYSEGFYSINLMSGKYGGYCKALVKKCVLIAIFPDIINSTEKK